MPYDYLVTVNAFWRDGRIGVQPDGDGNACWFLYVFSHSGSLACRAGTERRNRCNHRESNNFRQF